MSSSQQHGERVSARPSYDIEYLTIIITTTWGVCLSTALPRPRVPDRRHHNNMGSVSQHGPPTTSGTRPSSSQQHGERVSVLPSHDLGYHKNIRWNTSIPLNILGLYTLSKHTLLLSSLLVRVIVSVFGNKALL